MIIWIASYPKSGNTWVRAILNSLLYSKDTKININELQNKIRQFPIMKDFSEITKGSLDEEQFAKNCIYAQDKLNLDNKIKFFKTHNALWKFGNYAFTDESNTLGVIHVVRDPRNVITSILNHFNKTINNYEKALKFILDKKRMFGPEKLSLSENDLPTIISSWSNHYRSWKKFKKNNLLIKYENLLLKPDVEYLKIVDFLKKTINFKFEESKIKNVIENTQFEKLKTQENITGFMEAASKKNNEKINFFHLGPKNKWENLLNSNIKKSIENIFKDEMKELGYL